MPFKFLREAREEEALEAEVEDHFRLRHGRFAEERMAAPATPFQIKALEKVGMSPASARRMTRGEASVEIARRRRALAR